jgi:hypothetical protein
MAHEILEGVSELLIWYPILSKGKKNTSVREGRYDYPSAALSILPRDRYR